jgi:gamma-glutamyltranspeptidase / glutathione hydrolase
METPRLETMTERGVNVDVAHGDRPAGNRRGSRSPALARRGMVATSQPLASAAALAILREGGNAVDAAVAAAAVLSVIEPTMTGVGGDLFAMVYDPRDGGVHALNASGRAGSGARHALFRERGLEAVPTRGALSITVPGVVAGWRELLERHGTMTVGRVLHAAIEYARDGFPVAEIVAGQWREVEAVLAADGDAARTFLPAGRAPHAGEVFANPGLARTLETIATDGADAFYRGPLARALCEALRARGALLDLADFDGHRADWVDPLRTTYRGVEVCELPPNTQGLVALQILNLLEGFDLGALGHNSAAALHLMVEAKRLAFADRDAFLADPESVPPDLLAELVSKEYAARRRREIDPRRAAGRVEPGRPSTPAARSSLPIPTGRGDTVCLAVVDGHGTAVSLIQSLFESFGSGVVAGDTGVVFQNRGCLFAVDPRHPNCIGPRKRPFHTLVPAMALRDGKPWLSFGVMGGDMQPQGHVQVLANLLDFGMGIQDAGDAPRFRHSAAGIALESPVSAAAREGLASLGHVLLEAPGAFGGFQGVLVDRERGVLAGGSDVRKDGLAIGF